MASRGLVALPCPVSLLVVALVVPLEDSGRVPAVSVSKPAKQASIQAHDRARLSDDNGQGERLFCHLE
jgi:hypothetical protein